MPKEFIIKQNGVLTHQLLSSLQNCPKRITYLCLKVNKFLQNKIVKTKEFLKISFVMIILHIWKVKFKKE